ncbi:MAG TPA: phosphatidylcholine/phosphatidylserine synthase, partial [Lautropia sp.]|nr:phosphatidylcholine/phosphatidylserine synthase [Lautropia sp.]
EQYAAAAIAIFVAMLLDSLDGRVARLTNTQSAFGEQYDSLADVISFGAAPALVVYSWSLKGMGKWGWLAAFVFVAGAALRLARFNTNIHVVDKRFFQGLPSPAAAALVAGLVWIVTDLRESRWITSTGTDLGWLAWIVTVYAGLSMVSSAPFYSFKDINLKRSVPFLFLILLVLGFVLVSSDPPVVLFLLFVIYGLSGHALSLWRLARGLPALRRIDPGADAESLRASDAAAGGDSVDRAAARQATDVSAAGPPQPGRPDPAHRIPPRA